MTTAATIPINPAKIEITLTIPPRVRGNTASNMPSAAQHNRDDRQEESRECAGAKAEDRRDGGEDRWNAERRSRGGGQWLAHDAYPLGCLLNQFHAERMIVSGSLCFASQPSTDLALDGSA